MDHYNFIHNMKADSALSFLKKLNFETLENNDLFFYDFTEKLKNDKKINIRYNDTAILQLLIDSYIDECAYNGDNESFENVIGSINSILIKNSNNLYARNKAAFLYYTKYIYDYDDIYYDIVSDHIEKIIHHNNETSHFILAILNHLKYVRTKNNKYFYKALDSYKEVLNLIGNDINLSYNIFSLYKSKYINAEKEKHFDIAAEEYLEILDFDNDNIFALEHIAKLYKDQFLFTKNPDYYLLSINYYIDLYYTANDINILINVGFLHTIMFKYSKYIHFSDDAVSVFKKIEDTNNGNNILYNLLGYAYSIRYSFTQDNEDFSSAMNYYDKAKDLDNNAYYFIAYLYILCYKNTKDELYFNASLSAFNHLDTDDIDILNSLAYLYECRFSITRNKDDFDNSLFYYNKALAIDNDYFYTYINRFELYRLAFYYFDDVNYFKFVVNDYETLLNDGQLNTDNTLNYYMNYNLGCFYHFLYCNSLEDNFSFSNYNIREEFFSKSLLFFSHSNSLIAISDLYRLKYIEDHNSNKYFNLSLSYIEKNFNNFRYDIKNLLQKSILYYEAYKIEKDIKYFNISLENFNYALEINEYDKTLYYNLALLNHFKLLESNFENYQLAEKNYLKAIELDSTYYIARENLGFLYNNLYSNYNIEEIFNNSLSCFETVLYNDNKSLIALEGLGDIYNLKISNNTFDKETKYDLIMKCIDYYNDALNYGAGIDIIYKKLGDIYFILFSEYNDKIIINDYFDKYINFLQENRILANKYLFILNNVMYDIYKNNKYLIKAGKCLSSLNIDIFSIRLCIDFFKHLFDITKKIKYALFSLFYLEYIINIEKNNIDYYFDMGMLHYKIFLKTKNYEYAVNSFHCYSRVLDINSKYPKCNYNRALILKHLFEKTSKMYFIENAFNNLICSVNLGNIEAYSLMGDIYLLLYKKQKPDEEYLDRAIYNYNLSIENKYYGKNNYEVYFGMGICYYFKYKKHREIDEYYNNSLDYYKKALNANKKNVKIRRFIKYLQIIKRLPRSS
ncbi:tetratricopeptide repeat protein [Brachyspira hyodysenteriae]|uniref:tetratricopeptide repeat protein n=1 Tax=Brachyspira hyodysenteriae TaxID=159 RepID=UPI000B1F9605|nr:hypothetical protein [Brachyspira hyodysenteriae]